MELYTVNETAKMLKVSPITVRRYIASGQLEAERVGRAIRIRREAIEDFLKPVVPGGERITLAEAVGNIIGIGRSSKPTNIAEDKDDYIADAIASHWEDKVNSDEDDEMLGRPTSIDDPLWNIFGIGRSSDPTNIAEHNAVHSADSSQASSHEHDEEDSWPDESVGRPFTMDDALWSIFGIGESDDLTDVAKDKHKYLAEAYLADQE